MIIIMYTIYIRSLRTELLIDWWISRLDEDEEPKSNNDDDDVTIIL